MTSPVEPCTEEPVFAYTSKGAIQGRRCFYNGLQSKYVSFEHVPYAQVPVGDLRFADPRDFSSFGELVLEKLKLDTDTHHDEENCLFVSIYTKQVQDIEPTKHFVKPVIVFVPSLELPLRTQELQDFYGGELFMNEDVVLVVLHYRPEILGFAGFRASGSDKEPGISGIAGLCDIIKGFEFVKKEIWNFGGCPDDITAYGHGLGCEHLRYILTLPQFSKGKYFHKMILGSSMVHSKELPHLVPQYDIRHVAAAISRGEKFDNDKACLEYLRKVPIDVLLQYSTPLFDAKIDRIVTKKNLLAIQEDTYAVQMPVLIGFNSMEVLLERSIIPLKADLDPVKYLSRLLWWPTQSEATKAEAAKNTTEIIKVYKDGLKAIGCSEDMYLDMIESDIKYLVGIIHLAADLARKMHPENVYLYQFSVDFTAGEKFEWNLCDGKYYPGSSHADELELLFKLRQTTTGETPEKDSLVKHLTGIWAQFARTGNPNPTVGLIDAWRPIGKQLTHYCEIRHSSSIYREFTPFETVRFKLWEKVYGIDFFSAQIKKPEITEADEMENNVATNVSDITFLDESRRVQSYTMLPKADKQENVIAHTSKGTIQGVVCFYHGVKYYSFQHVPYAQVPDGNLRFSAPKDISSFTDVKYQGLDEFGRYGHEDNLFLHIYTLELKPVNEYHIRSKYIRPVIVFVPGQLPDEAERYRSEDLYGPQFLMEENVVLVVLSYRRGILGFTAFDEPNAELDVPIDAGIQDIMQGFRFVKNEIENFGGCSDNVTAYGQGTGATWVRRIAAKHAKDNLFHKMILSSSMEHATGIELPMPRYNVRSLVKADFKQEDLTEDKDCIEFLRSMPIEQLLSRDVPLFKLPTKYRMLRDEHLLALAKESSYETTMPVMLGYNSMEGLLEQMIGSNYDQNYDIHQSCSTESTDQELLSDEQQKETERAKQIKAFYNKETVGVNIGMRIMLSDGCYIIGTLALAYHFARTMAPGNVYLYRCEVMSACNFIKKLYSCMIINRCSQGGQTIAETAHADELGLIFKTPITRSVMQRIRDHCAIKRMTTLWAQFARTGNPNPIKSRLIGAKWMPVGESFHLFKIGTKRAKKSTIESEAEYGRFKFWMSLTGLDFIYRCASDQKTDKSGDRSVVDANQGDGTDDQTQLEEDT